MTLIDTQKSLPELISELLKLESLSKTFDIIKSIEEHKKLIKLCTTHNQQGN